LSDYVLRTRLAVRAAGWIECEEIIWLKPDAPPLGSIQRPRRTWESILWFSKSTKPYVDLRACGRESNRIGGLYGSRRFGEGGKSPIHEGQKNDLSKKGISRIGDVVEARIGDIDEYLPHPAMFPYSLANFLVRTFSKTGDAIIDPFCGSGTSLLAAMRNNRRYMGIDIHPKYVKLATKRLAYERDSRPEICPFGEMERISP
jgi:DNA modification methylase